MLTNSAVSGSTVVLVSVGPVLRRRNIVMEDDRSILTDETWESLATVIREVKSAAGAPPELTDREFVEAILYLARTGVPWRDLSKRFGKWNAVYKRFRRWEEMGVWRALFERAPTGLESVRTVFFDSTVIRAHAHAAGAPAKKGGKQRRRWAGVAAVSARSSTSRLRTRRRLSSLC